MDPLLQRVFQVLLADGMRQHPESWLELDDGRGQVFEPAAQLHLVLQDTDAFSWGEEDQGRVTGKLTPDLEGISKSHPVFLWGQPDWTPETGRERKVEHVRGPLIREGVWQRRGRRERRKKGCVLLAF